MCPAVGNSFVTFRTLPTSYILRIFLSVAGVSFKYIYYITLGILLMLYGNGRLQTAIASYSTIV